MNVCIEYLIWNSNLQAYRSFSLIYNNIFRRDALSLGSQTEKNREYYASYLQSKTFQYLQIDSIKNVAA